MKVLEVPKTLQAIVIAFGGPPELDGKNIAKWVSINASMIKSTDCFFRGTKFNSQYLHGSSQLFVTPITWYHTFFSRFHRQYTWYIDIHAAKTFIYTKFKNKNNKKGILLKIPPTLFEICREIKLELS